MAEYMKVVTFEDLKSAAAQVEVEVTGEDKEADVTAFLDKVDEVLAATPEGQKPELDPQVILIYNSLGHFTAEGKCFGMVNYPGMTEEENAAILAQVEAEEKVEKPEKAEKAEKAKKEKAPKEKAPKKEKVRAPKEKPGREGGMRGLCREMLLEGKPEGVILQTIADHYVTAKGKTQEYGVQRAKKIYYDIHKELVEAGKIEARPKPKKEKPEKPETAEAAEAASAGEASEAEAQGTE